MKTATQPQLTVIQGDGQPRPRLLRLPRQVIGPSPFRSDLLVGYRIAETEVRTALENQRRQPVLDLWSMVIGKLPPVQNASKFSGIINDLSDQSLMHAHAAFRGLQRAIGDDTRGWDHVAFITKPRLHLRYVPSMVCVIEPDEVPDDVVLATYVKLDFPEGRPNDRQNLDVPMGGIVTHWELIETDSADSLLPVHYHERYRRRLW
jgi:hypothetical protein